MLLIDMARQLDIESLHWLPAPIAILRVTDTPAPISCL